MSENGMENASRKVYSWDDILDVDSGYELLPEGDYVFEVKEIKQTMYEGSKLPRCPEAIVTLTITTEDGERTLNDWFFMVEGLIERVSELFCAVGHKKRGEPVKMSWKNLLKTRGRAHIVQVPYNKNGEQRTVNKVKEYYYYDPETQCRHEAKMDARIKAKQQAKSFLASAIPVEDPDLPF